MDIAKLQEFFRNGTYILGPYMAGFENTGKDEDFWNGNDASIFSSRQVSPAVFGQWLMNAKAIQVVYEDDFLDCADEECTELQVETGYNSIIYNRIFNLSGPLHKGVLDPYNSVYAQGPANFHLLAGYNDATWSLQTGEAGDDGSEDYWGLFSQYNWYGVDDEENVSFSPVPYLSCIHKYGRYYFNWHLNEAQEERTFKGAGLNKIEFEDTYSIDEFTLTNRLTINRISTFF
jgi:hypothetical protein